MHVWQGLELVLLLSYICTDNIYSLTSSEIYSRLELGLIMVAVECIQCIGLAPQPLFHCLRLSELSTALCTSKDAWIDKSELWHFTY